MNSNSDLSRIRGTPEYLYVVMNHVRGKKLVVPEGMNPSLVEMISSAMEETSERAIRRISAASREKSEPKWAGRSHFSDNFTPRLNLPKNYRKSRRAVPG